MTEPRLAVRLLRLFIPADARAEILGDLAERFARRKERHGERAARRWYRRQVVSFFLLAVRERVRALSRINLRSTSMIRPLLQDIRYAIRTLRRTPVFTVTAITTLAIGIGATTAVFSAVESVVLSPLPYANSDQLVRVYSSYRDDPDDREFNTAPDFLDFREQINAFETLATVYTYRETGVDFQTPAGPVRLRGLEISAKYFEVLGTPLMMGREFTREEEDGNSQLVILSYATWRDLMNEDPNIVGQSINLVGIPFTVVGVAPAGFQDPIVGLTDLWVPENLAPGGSNTRGNYFLSILGRLKRDATIEQARAQLDVITAALAQNDSRYPENQYAAVDPLLDDVVGSTRPILYLLLGGALLVLIIASVNVANLHLVRALARHRELALRAALGSGRGRLVMQLLVEGMVIAVLGGVTGTVAAMLGIRALLGISPDSLARANEIGFDPVVLLFALGVTGITGILFSLAPALRSSDLDVGDALRMSTRGTTGGVAGRRARAVLATGQVALALVLLSGAAILARNLWEQQRADLGFDERNIMSFEVNLPTVRYDVDARIRFHDELQDRLRALPGIENVGAVSKLPASGGFHFWWYEWPPVDGEETGDGIQVRVVEGDYFEALKIGLVAGRLLDERDVIDAPLAALLNVSAATHAFGDRDPLGRQIEAGGREWTVVGVVDDVAHEARGVFGRKIYFPHGQYADNRNWPLVQVVESTRPLGVIVDLVRTELARLDPQLALYRPLSLESMLAGERERERFATVLMGTFAVVALLLASTGLYGVLAYMVGQRTHEMGIRMALGAPAGHVRGLILRQVGLVIGGGVLVGLGLSLVAAQLLESLVFGINPRDPMTLGVVTVIIVLTAIAAGVLPARRATRVAPGQVLR
jgi:predicted permease